MLVKGGGAQSENDVLAATEQLQLVWRASLKTGFLCTLPRTDL